MRLTCAFGVAVVAVVSVLGSSASALTGWDELVQGDLSNDRFNPTAILLEPGVFSLSANTRSTDLDYLSVTIPDGQVLWALNNTSWTGNDRMAFIAVQAGSTFTESPSAPNPDNMLGWAHFGPGMGTVGTNILPLIGGQEFAIGFTPPLAAGTYTFWLNQTSSAGASYSLDFVVIPSGGTSMTIASGAIMLLRRRRR